MFQTEMTNGIPEVKAENLADFLKDHDGPLRLIDVRRPDEYSGELGHIEGATLITLGPDLQAYLEKGATENFKNETIVFICRSGGRSGQATMFSQQLGYTQVYNMQGGMLRWNDLKLPIQF